MTLFQRHSMMSPNWTNWNWYWIALAIVIVAVIFHFNKDESYPNGVYIEGASRVPTKSEFEEIKSNAENGDARAQLYMGIFYCNGSMVKQSFKTAAKFYLQASLQGNETAQRNLGFLYDCGVGVEQSYEQALLWYGKAVEKIEPAAMFALSGFPFAFREKLFPRYKGSYNYWRLRAFSAKFGMVVTSSIEEEFWTKYYNSFKFVQNDIEVIKTVYRSALDGNNESQLRMSLFYLQGQCVKKDSAEVITWLMKSAEGGNIRAKFILGVHSIDRKYFISPSLTEEQRKSWLDDAANSRSELYFSYINPKFSKIDHSFYGYLPAIKEKWNFGQHHENNDLSSFEYAANDGDSESAALLVMNYLTGMASDRNFELAAKWFDCLLKLGDYRSVEIILSDARVISQIYQQNTGINGDLKCHVEDCVFLKLLGVRNASKISCETSCVSRCGAAYYFTAMYFEQISKRMSFYVPRYLSHVFLKIGSGKGDIPSTFELLANTLFSQEYMMLAFMPRTFKVKYCASSKSFTNFEDVLQSIMKFQNISFGVSIDSRIYESPVIGYTEREYHE